MNENIYPELNLALDDMQKQSALYRPTAFWETASMKIVDEIRINGVERFRSLKQPLSFFVPTYGMPANSFTPAQTNDLKSLLCLELPKSNKALLGLEQFLSGKASALADYRVLLAADNPLQEPNLQAFSESAFGEPIEHFEFDGHCFSRSSLNYLLGLALLKKHLGTDIPRSVLEVGGGFGSLGEVLAGSGIEGLRYIDVDIPPTSFVAQRYLSHVLGVDCVIGYDHTHQAKQIRIDELPLASVLCSWQIPRLEGKIDLFVNFISFQEMEPPVVNNYLHHVDRLGARWVLLRNLREGKQVRKTTTGVGVDQPVLGDDYLSMLPGYDLVERNVHPFGYQTVDGFHSELLLLRRKL